MDNMKQCKICESNCKEATPNCPFFKEKKMTVIHFDQETGEARILRQPEHRYIHDMGRRIREARERYLRMRRDRGIHRPHIIVNPTDFIRMIGQNGQDITWRNSPENAERSIVGTVLNMDIVEDVDVENNTFVLVTANDQRFIFARRGNSISIDVGDAIHAIIAATGDDPRFRNGRNIPHHIIHEIEHAFERGTIEIPPTHFSGSFSMTGDANNFFSRWFASDTQSEDLNTDTDNDTTEVEENDRDIQV